MKKINFMTIGDKKYFPFIYLSIKRVMKFYPTSTFFIYDWGFTRSQRKIIKSFPITELIDWTKKIDRVFGYRTIIKTYEGYNPPYNCRRTEYLLNQKPNCLLNCAERVKENIIYLDGDAILINPIDEIFEDDFDIGLTISSKERRIEFEENLLSHPNSKVIFSNTNTHKEKNFSGLNAGVLFFKLASKPMQIFIHEWMKEIKTCKRWLIEQTSLILLLKKRNKEILNKNYNVNVIKISNIEFKIKTFPQEMYNCSNVSYDYKKVKILHLIHFKNKYISELKPLPFIRRIIRKISNNKLI